MVTLAPRGDDEEWGELEEIKLWPEGGEGQGICGEEGGPGPPRMYISFAPPLRSSFCCHLFLAAPGGKEMGMPH